MLYAGITTTVISDFLSINQSKNDASYHFDNSQIGIFENSMNTNTGLVKIDEILQNCKSKKIYIHYVSYICHNVIFKAVYLRR